MPKNKYTPPPSNKGQNTDRGYTNQQEKKEEKPLSTQFPIRPSTTQVDTTDQWWNK